MTVLTYVKPNLIGIRFDCYNELVNLLREIPTAKFDKKVKQWTIHIDYWQYVLDLFCAEGQKTIIAPNLEPIINKKRSYLEALTKLKGLRDYKKLTHPKAHLLYPYQRVGVKFLSLPGNKLLTDEMGCGKSAQAIIACEEISARRILIVCPNSLKYTWSEEIEKWGDSLPYTIFKDKISKSKKLKSLEEYFSLFNSGYLIINYEAIRTPYLEWLIAHTWDCIIFDESIKIKNPKTQVTINCSQLIGKKKILLSGAPITKATPDLFSQLMIIKPDKYLSYWKFAEKYSNIEQNFFGITVKGGKSLNELKSDIFEFTLRRTKKEVMKDLPPKIKQIIRLENMTAFQKRVYKTIRDQIIQEIDSYPTDKLEAPYIITRFLRLAQTTSTTANLDMKDASAKLDYIEEIIEERLIDHKIVIWTCFVPTAHCLRSRLKPTLEKRNISLAFITGHESSKEKQEAVNRFNNDLNCKILVSTFAGKYGFSLVPKYETNILVIYPDRNFNYDDYIQSQDRTHRCTTVVSPEYFILLQKDTIDEYINLNLSQKEATLAGIFKMDKAIILDRREVKNVLLHPEDCRKEAQNIEQKRVL